ncbi:MAG: zinc-dependent peptidase [Algibacter sp.]
MIYSLLIEEDTLSSEIIYSICFSLLGFLVIYFLVKIYETAYVYRKKKPIYVHFYPRLRKLSKRKKAILRTNFPFYNKLSDKHKLYFEHRLECFILDKDFVSQSQFKITDEMIVLISATAVMLTFGFRDFYIPLISKIVIYPEAFYSNINKTYHKGEFNPKLKALVLSWKDFQEGYRVDNDNLNLGIHEFTHAIHLNSMKERDVSSTIFNDTFKGLTGLLSNNKELRDKLISSEYFRGYAYTNQFEFLAVLIENFIETPDDFRASFPEIYAKVGQMLNFSTYRF